MVLNHRFDPGVTISFPLSLKKTLQYPDSALSEGFVSKQQSTMMEVMPSRSLWDVIVIFLNYIRQ